MVSGTSGAVLLLLLLPFTAALQDGAAPRPPLGWSTWLTFQLQLNESLVRSSADFLASSALSKAGYEYILIDDGTLPPTPKDDRSSSSLQVLGLLVS